MNARTILRTGYFRMTELLGGVRRLRAALSPGSVIVLNFHKVEPRPNPFWWPVHPANFEGLVKDLKHHCTIRSIFDSSRSPTRSPQVVLSFDDGYQSFVQYVAPILRRHGVRANLNIIPECVITGRPPWNIRLYDFLGSADSAALGEFRIEGFSKPSGSWDDDNGKARFGLGISRYLKNRSRAERERLLEPMAHLLDSARDPALATAMMTMRDVEEVSDVADFGAHSFAHDTMGFETDEFFQRDLRECARFFSERLRMSMDVYAFPHGSYRPTQLQLLQNAGISHVLLVGEKIGRSGATTLPRLTMYGHSVSELRLRAFGYGASKDGNNVRH